LAAAENEGLVEDEKLVAGDAAAGDAAAGDAAAGDVAAGDEKLVELVSARCVTTAASEPAAI
jgi:hypothetical protein